MSQIVESLFGVSPERYQQQKDAALQQEALAYAQLDPLQRATAGIYAGARGLAGGIGRMLGGEDPGMRRVTEQDQIIRSIDLNNPETFGPAAQRAYQMGHTELAQKIMNRYSQLQESSALIGQRQAAAGASKAQAAKSQAEIDEIASQNRAFAALTGQPPVATQPVAAEPMAAGPNGTDVYGNPYSVDIRPVEMRSVAPRTSAMGVDLPPAAPVAPVAPVPASQTRTALSQQIAELEKRRLQFLSLPKVPAAKAQADVLGDQIKDLREQGKPVVVGNTLVNSSNGYVIYQGDKPEKLSAFAQELIDAGLSPGTEPFQNRMLEYVTSKTKGAAKGTGNVTIGGINIDTGEAAKAAGKVVGANLANVENQYSLQTAFKDAIDLVDQGIYGGAYGPEKQFVAKFTGIGSPKKVENTEVFLANIGEIVIPRLQQFGGNDSNEELKYLQKVVAGDLRLEPAAVKRILASAERKVQNNIKRLLKQKEGGELPTEPMTLAPAATPKATLRYNPQTRKIEPIAGN